MWSSTPHKTYIEEANKHLEMLTEKCHSLEVQNAELTSKLKECQDTSQKMLHDLQEKSQSVISELKAQMARQDQRLYKMERELEAKKTEVNNAKERGHMLDEIVKYKSTLAKLTISMEQAEQFTEFRVNKRAYQTQIGPTHNSGSSTINGGGSAGALINRVTQSYKPESVIPHEQNGASFKMADMSYHNSDQSHSLD